MSDSLSRYRLVVVNLSLTLWLLQIRRGFSDPTPPIHHFRPSYSRISTLISHRPHYRRVCGHARWSTILGTVGRRDRSPIRFQCLPLHIVDIHDRRRRRAQLDCTGSIHLLECLWCRGKFGPRYHCLFGVSSQPRSVADYTDGCMVG